jgi:hypothetical protein
MASLSSYHSTVASGIASVDLTGSSTGLQALRPAASAMVTEDDSDESGYSTSGSTDEDDEEGADADDKAVASLLRPQQIRPLTVIELCANVEAACADCIFGATPLVSSERTLPVDVALFVSVCVHVGQPEQQLPTCATINEVSRLFRFNDDQHRAFAICGRAFLGFLAREDAHAVMPDAEVAGLQRLLEIHGMGGTGKSHVINGWLALSASWSRPHAVSTFAITGVAAINVSGQTFARLTFAYSKFGMTDKLRNKWLPTRMMILDEQSMVKCVDLNMLSNFLKAVTGRHSMAFGGVIVILAGDFFQLAPVAGAYLFRDPGGTSAAKYGFELYRMFTDVVVLRKVTTPL